MISATASLFNAVQTSDHLWVEHSAFLSDLFHQFHCNGAISMYLCVFHAGFHNTFHIDHIKGSR